MAEGPGVPEGGLAAPEVAPREGAVPPVAVESSAKAQPARVAASAPAASASGVEAESAESASARARARPSRASRVGRAVPPIGVFGIVHGTVDVAIAHARPTCATGTLEDPTAPRSLARPRASRLALGHLTAGRAGVSRGFAAERSVTAAARPAPVAPPAAVPPMATASETYDANSELQKALHRRGRRGNRIMRFGYRVPAGDGPPGGSASSRCSQTRAT